VKKNIILPVFKYLKKEYNNRKFCGLKDKGKDGG